MTDLPDQADLLDSSPSNIPPWLARFLHANGVVAIEANFSGGGDSGCMDDMSLTMRPDAERSSKEVLKLLSKHRRRVTVIMEHSMDSILADCLDKDACGVGNFYDGDGGAVWLRVGLTEAGAFVEAEDFVENSFEDDYDDDEFDDYEW